LGGSQRHSLLRQLTLPLERLLRDDAAGTRARTLVVGGLALTTFLGAIFVHVVVRQSFLDNMDERNYLWLARRLLEGRLTAEPLPAEFWDQLWVYWRGHTAGGRLFTQYPVIWPAQAAIGVGVGAPWLVNALLAAGVVVLVYHVAAAAYRDYRVALVTAVLTASSPFLVFQAGTLLSHVSTLFWLLLGTLLLLDGRRRLASTPLLGAGLAYGLAFSTRPFDALATALPIVTAMVAASRGDAQRVLRVLALVACGTLVGLLPFFLYNAAITGNALTPTMTLFSGTVWVTSFAGWYASVGVVLEQLRAWRSWFLPAPFVLLTWVLLLRRGRMNPIDVMSGLIIICLVAAYSLNATHYDIAGPRYHFTALVPALLIWSRLAVTGSRRIAVIALLASTGYFAQLHVRQGRLMRAEIHTKRALNIAVQRANLQRAVVLIPDGFQFGMFARDLLDNSPGLQGIVYAMDRGPGNASLLARFPGVPVFRWPAGDRTWPGRLSPLRPDSVSPPHSIR
jgi:hypothetical protein